jgi:hypothetical protein
MLEDLRGFPQSHQSDTKVVPFMGPDLFLPHPFHLIFYIHSNIQRYKTYAVEKASSNNARLRICSDSRYMFFNEGFDVQCAVHDPLVYKH